MMWALGHIMSVWTSVVSGGVGEEEPVTVILATVDSQVNTGVVAAHRAVNGSLQIEPIVVQTIIVAADRRHRAAVVHQQTNQLHIWKWMERTDPCMVGVTSQPNLVINQLVLAWSRIRKKSGVGQGVVAQSRRCRPH